jgi:hypothetical protein
MIITYVSRRPSAPDGYGGHNEPMWSLELKSAWTRSDIVCNAHVLAESEPHIMATSVAMLSPNRPTVACAGCVAEASSNTEHTTESRASMPSLVPLSTFTTNIFQKLHVDINECVNLLHIANLVPTSSNRARPESTRFASRLSYGALAFLASDPSTTGHLGELCDIFPNYFDVVFRVVVCRIFGLSSPRILSILRFPAACAFMPSLGSSYAGCIRVGGCRHVG